MAERIRTRVRNGNYGVRRRPPGRHGVRVLQVHRRVQAALHRSSSKSPVSNLTSEVLGLAQASGVTSTPDGCFLSWDQLPPHPSPHPGLGGGRGGHRTHSLMTQTGSRGQKTKGIQMKVPRASRYSNKSHLIRVRFYEELQYSINIDDASMQV